MKAETQTVLRERPCLPRLHFLWNGQDQGKKGYAMSPKWETLRILSWAMDALVGQAGYLHNDFYVTCVDWVFCASTLGIWSPLEVTWPKRSMECPQWPEHCHRSLESQNHSRGIEEIIHLYCLPLLFIIMHLHYLYTFGQDISYHKWTKAKSKKEQSILQSLLRGIVWAKNYCKV